MKRRHIAIFTFPAAGHVYPMLGICSELVKRGYHVTYATTDHYAHRIRQTGAEPVVFSIAMLETAGKLLRIPPSCDLRFWQLYASLFCPLLLYTAVGTLSELEGFYHENAPDLVLYDIPSYAGRILARRLNTPAIQLFVDFANQGFLTWEHGIRSNPKPMLGFSQLLDSFLSVHGIDDKNNLWHTEKLNICFVPKEFQLEGDSFDDRFCFVGPCLNRPVDSMWKNNSRGKPIILVSQSQACGDDSSYIKNCIDALADSEYHIVLSIGRDGPRSFLSALPANCEINEHAYNLEIFPHAVLTICQAGMGTTLESLYCGVPVLAVPVTPVHAEVAYRVAELGLGSYLPEQNMTIDMVRENVARILGDPAIRDRVNLMQQVTRDSGGAEMAANRIEGMLRS